MLPPILHEGKPVDYQALVNEIMSLPHDEAEERVSGWPGAGGAQLNRASMGEEECASCTAVLQGTAWT